MWIAGSPDIFQEKMSDLMATLEFVQTYKQRENGSCIVNDYKVGGKVLARKWYPLQIRKPV